MSDKQKIIHDLRKPLNTISMQAELIKMLTETHPNGDKVDIAAKKIIENAKLCSNMLQTLFDDEAS